MTGTSAPLVKVEGRNLPGLQADDLVSLRISRTTGAAAHCELRYDDPATLGSNFLIGNKITVDAIDDEATSVSVFVGEVVSLGIDLTSSRSHLVVGAYDPSYVFGSRTVSKSHLNTTVGTIVREIADLAKLSTEIDQTVGGQSFDHVQQSGTPHQFLSDLARAFGCEWFVDSKKIVFRRRKAGGPVATLSGGFDLRRFSARLSGVEQAASVSVRGWDPETKAAIAGSFDSKGNTPGHDVPITKKGVKAKFVGKEATASPIAVDSQAQADTIAEGIAGRLEAAKLTGRGEVDVNGYLVPGALIKIEDSVPDWNGSYYLTGVEHVFGDGQPFVTRFTIGALEPSTLVDMFGHQPRTTRERLTSGVTIGEVTDTNDPEGLLRVKVRLPFLSDDNVSQWARIVSPGAGKGRGSLSLPEIGDEVLVAFENGDLQRPYVLGGLWNGKDKSPPLDGLIKDGKIMSRSMTSRTGHQFVMSDGDSPEDLFVEITLKDGKTLLHLGEEKIEIVSADKPIKIDNGKGSIQIAADGAIAITGTKVTIEATKGGDVGITGTNVKSEATATHSSEGAQVEITGKASAKLDGGGMTEVKGGMVKLN